MHERVTLNQAINLCKALEPYHPFFVEDPLPPEENDHFRLLRQQTCVPIAMGELFNNQHEYVPLIKDRLIDFIRIHISQIGGLSPARKVRDVQRILRRPNRLARPRRRLADRARRATGDRADRPTTSASTKAAAFPPTPQAVFVGCPEVKNGYMLAREKPGLGIEVDEQAAARFPVTDTSAELRLLVGHDAPARRHGHPTVVAIQSRLGRRRYECHVTPLRCSA